MSPARTVCFRFALGSYSTWSTRLFPGLLLRLLPLGAHSKTTHNGLLDFLTYISEHLWLLIKSVINSGGSLSYLFPRLFMLTFSTIVFRFPSTIRFRKSSIRIFRSQASYSYEGRSESITLLKAG